MDPEALIIPFINFLPDTEDNIRRDILAFPETRNSSPFGGMRNLVAISVKKPEVAIMLREFLAPGRLSSALDALKQAGLVTADVDGYRLSYEGILSIPAVLRYFGGTPDSPLQRLLSARQMREQQSMERPMPWYAGKRR